MLSKDSTDEELWCGVIAEDSYAFNLLFERYWKPIYTTSYNFLKNKEIAQEITQEIFIVLWNKRKELKINSFRNYLNAMAKYKVFKHARASKSSPVVYMTDYPLIENTYCNNKGDENLVITDLFRNLYLHLDDMPARCKEIFVMSRIEQLSNSEIAEKLHISKRTVETQISNALKHLRKTSQYSALLLAFIISVISN